MDQVRHTELAVDAVDVTKTYGDLVAVDHLSPQVAPGEGYGILGPDGAGKATFRRMLFGLIRPDSGSVRVFGRSWARSGVGAPEEVGEFGRGKVAHEG